MCVQPKKGLPPLVHIKTKQADPSGSQSGDTTLIPFS